MPYQKHAQYHLHFRGIKKKSDEYIARRQTEKASKNNKDNTSTPPPQKSVPLAEISYTLPKIPVRQSVVITPPAIQMAIAEIVEEADVILKEKIIENTELTSEKEQVVTSEPQVIEISKTIDENSLKEAFETFANKQTPSTSALIKMFEPKVEENEIRVAMHKANINLTEPIKIEWQKFLREYFNHPGLVLTLIEDDTVVKQTQAYTQRERLDELTRENPLMRELIKKLNLKLK